MYSHCNICNIPIYFCNIHMKHLQHTSETSETLETYTCNMRFSVNPCRRVGWRSIAQWDLALGYGGEGGWSRDATKKVRPETEMPTKSAQGPPHGHGREAWWEKGVGESENAAPRSGMEDRGRDAEEGRQER